MRRLPRRLALWGGAAAFAGGGFAFMANNPVTASSAGEGVGPISGYTVSTISYNTGTGYNCDGVTGCDVGWVSFKLATKNGTTSSEAYMNPPKFIYVSLNGTTGYLSNADGYAGGSAPGTQTQPKTTLIGCRIVTGGWSTGHGMFQCGFNPKTVKIHTITKLDVEANN